MSLIAIALAMFGLSGAALVVYRFKNHFPQESVQERCAQAATAFGWSTVLGVGLTTNLPVTFSTEPVQMLFFLVWSLVLSLPFFFSGLFVCLALTRYTQSVGRLYAYDLFGASLGCLSVVALLNLVDAPTAVLCIAALGLVSGALLDNHKAKISTITVAILALLNPSLGLFKVRYVLGVPIDRALLKHELWNSFSYISVTHSTPEMNIWGPSDSIRRRQGLYSERMLLTMDTRNGTCLVHFDGDWDKMDWLNHDAVNAVHFLRTQGHALVLGVGGGRDVLSALIPSRGNRQVTGVEINPITHKLVTQVEKDYVNLKSSQPLSIIHDEARSWVARNSDTFEAITIPLVDTSASSAAGAFALTENGLYTVEAFQSFIEHLKPEGILSVSRWWHHGAIGETHRLVNLAMAALEKCGVAQPAQHIVVVRGGDLANLLCFRSPVTTEDLEKLNSICHERGFEILLQPNGPSNQQLAMVASSPQPLGVVWTGAAHIDLTPPTDDRPYFFHCYSMSNLLNSSRWETKHGVSGWDQQAMIVLATMTCCVVGLSAILFGYVWTQAAPTGSRAWSITYFGAIGVGYMLCESAQLGRLSLFLGYPIYSLTVVLFTLLVSSALASWLTQLNWVRQRPWWSICLAAVFTLGVVGWLTPIVLNSCSALSEPVRIALAVVLVAPTGLVLGMLYPTGIRQTEQLNFSPGLAWAANGICSTPAAVGGISIGLVFGAQNTFWCACGAYLVAALAAYMLSRQSKA